LEDPRLSRMYAALLIKRFDRWRRSLWHIALMRSGLLTMIVLTAGLLGLAFGWRAHTQGRFARLKSELNSKQLATPAVVVRPGGQDPVVLERSQIAMGTAPEFLTATLLPGRGMNVLQITAYIPGKGEVQLLASPSLDEAAKLLNDTAASAATSLGGAFEAPWANRIFGAAAGDGKSLTVNWRGHMLGLPVTSREHGAEAVATSGLLLKRASDSVRTNVMPDGAEALAIYNADNFDGHWLSRTEITTSVQLSSRVLEINILTRNTGEEAEPVGIGWHPRFAILSGDRGQMTLKMPSGLRAEVRDRRSGLPSGRLLPVAGTEYDFTARNGARLGELSLDDSFVHLRAGLLENGPVAELRDPKSKYGLRITAMTPSIKAMRAYAPAGANFVSIEPQFNYDDPFGREWASDEDTGMVVLQPGQSVEWKIRLEILPLAGVETNRL
jgi:aldose 1-epimerase